jgi:hypothetical protein
MSDDPRLQHAKSLIKRLKCREFYKFVAEILIPTNQNYGKFTEKDIIKFAS